MTIKYVPCMLELPGGVWVNPAKVEAVMPEADQNGTESSLVWFEDGKLTFIGVKAADVARAINKGVMRNTVLEG